MPEITLGETETSKEGNSPAFHTCDSQHAPKPLRDYAYRIIDICEQWASNGFPQARLIARDIRELPVSAHPSKS